MDDFDQSSDDNERHLLTFRCSKCEATKPVFIVKDGKVPECCGQPMERLGPPPGR